MPVPQFSKLYIPLLKLAEKEQITTHSVIIPLAKEFSLDAKDLKDLLMSANVRKIVDRVSWAIRRLQRAGLLARVARGHYITTDAGKEVLKNPPPKLDSDYLSQLEADREEHLESPKIPAPESHADVTPQERIASAFHELEHHILDELKSEIISLSPAAFASLAVEVVETLRYGSHHVADEPATEYLDVKNVIIRDPLGLDSIYVRASHRTRDHVKADEMEDFLKSMGSFHKGIYITDGDFDQEARKIAANSTKTINLIDLFELASIMNRYNIGLRIQRLLEIKNVDKDFFDDLEK
jgi:restriction system protein